ncbi:MAG: polysaccharide pyruvyl transferase family protein [Oscillospiraceae bacterium]|jgi:hypothetical protein|nr:polysaccharide pyruvyl transferase family protein [Oscillospiraceae bacterium]
MNKKVGIVSCYFKKNYGSALQAYATQRALDGLQIDNETIDIRCISKEISRGKLNYYRRNAFDLSMYSAKKGFARHLLQQRIDPDFKNNMRKRRIAFRQFEQDNFRMSTRYKSKFELSQACGNYTDVLVGSDQLWLPLNIEGDYYTLNFVPSHINKISYATSFGVPRLPAYLLERAMYFLNRIEHVSVREESGRRLVREITNRDVPVVCDPTMLLTGEQWRDIQQKEPLIKEPYIFCYFLGNNPEHRAFARRLKKESGCKIAALRHLDEYIPGDNDFGDFAPYDAGPEDFLNLIKNAEYICTDSFHGTTFSALNNKKFFTFRRFRKANAHSTNTRIEYLLSALGISDRLLEGNEDVLRYMSKTIDFSSVNARMVEIRKSSMDFLITALYQ